MESIILKAFLNHGIAGIMLAWTNLLLFWGAKKFLELFKNHTSMIAQNTKVIEANTQAWKEVKNYLEKNEEKKEKAP